jgi:hypothetical protein
VDDVRLKVARSIVVPKGRKYLCADALFRLLCAHCATIADDRVAEVEMPLSDALLAACAMVSLKAPSLLAFDKQRAEGKVQTISGMAHPPCDTRMRERLDPVSPESLRPSFTLVFRQLQRGKALEPRAFLEGHSLVALDGTGSFASKTMHCAAGLPKEHHNGSITYYHQMLGAAILPPDGRAVIPRMPEPIVKQDGTQKNDGERQAAKRFIPKLRQDPPPLKVISTADALRAHAPHLETLHDYGGHSILGGKAGAHASLFKQGQAAEAAGGVTYEERHDRAAGMGHRLRFVNHLPRHGARADVRVNGIEYGEMGQDKAQPFSWVTDRRGSPRHVSKLMRGGRARWKSANETCNTLKNQGDNFAHTYGHGEQHLSVVCAMLMMLAFVVDQTQQRCCALFQAVWAKLGSKRLLWERMRSLFYSYELASLHQLLAALFYGWKRPQPILAIDASSSQAFLCDALARTG